MTERVFFAQLARAAPRAFGTRNVWWNNLTGGGGARAPASSFERPLDTNELAFVGALAEGIIPATETPGAIGAGVPQFVGLLFTDWFTREEQIDFRSGLAALSRASQAKCSRVFASCDPAQQQALLSDWDKDAFADRPHDAPKPFFRRFKELTIIGYYTSEVGQNQELKAEFGGGQDVPGGPVSQPPPFRM